MSDEKAPGQLAVPSELRLIFDPEAQAVTIASPGGQKVTLDDARRVIVLVDACGNTLRMSGQGIELDSVGDLRLKARGTIALESDRAIVVESRGDARISGVNVIHEAQGRLDAHGGAMAELKAAGVVSVQAPLVKIN